MAAFNVSGLTSVTLPNSVTTIGFASFSQCLNLTSVTLPNSITAIDKNAFSYCANLKEVTVEWTTPFSISLSDSIFYNVSTSAATLRVPTGTKARYQAASVWKDFGTIVEYSPTGIEQFEAQTLKAYASNGLLHITGLQPGVHFSIYNLAGQLVYQGIAKTAEEYVSLAARGVYIVAAGEQKVKVINN